MSTAVIIRQETEKDYRAVEELTRDAFWDVYKPGCDEHLLAHKLRQSTAFLPQLDFVAVRDNCVVGNIMYSVAQVVDSGDQIHPVLTFGPLSVKPAYQGQGVGIALVQHTLSLAKTIGYPGVIIFGNPSYYHRFGFANAEHFGISTRDGINFDAFMALALHQGALKGITGRFFENEVFHVDPAELAEFEKAFPKREKHITDTQL